jgi:hypothetical protein
MKPKAQSLAGYVSKNVYDGKRYMTPAEADVARRSVEANRDVLRVGREQLERIEDEADLKEIRARLAKPAGKPFPIKEAADRLGIKL